ncbi:unnamed protein product [Spirodela intermedia]|uniref:Uncharacterized protein n=1 Tax=Spirodela intermedia TaxID=51605 RepID=A0A7I8KG72_SPIIN|nr:unnamed protein product [Spirodela intermedia]
MRGGMWRRRERRKRDNEGGYVATAGKRIRMVSSRREAKVDRW